MNLYLAEDRLFFLLSPDWAVILFPVATLEFTVWLLEGFTGGTVFLRLMRDQQDFSDFRRYLDPVSKGNFSTSDL